MAIAPNIRLSKYFGGASIQQNIMTLDEARGQLQYFFTQDGGKNITVSVDGKKIKSFEDLLALSSQDKYQKDAYIDVGLFLSNDGTKSIWPAKPA
ncbi:MAG TPA: hypothetical protein VLH15_02975 [Dehalococcoidales bacterium]|nr:hypothetical protein [Dehalococcoidales bacterium]